MLYALTNICTVCFTKLELTSKIVKMAAPETPSPLRKRTNNMLIDEAGHRYSYKYGRKKTEDHAWACQVSFMILEFKRNVYFIFNFFK